MRILHSIEPKEMIEFVKLFPKAAIHSLEFDMYNGTATRYKELSNGVDYTSTQFKLHGNTLAQMEDALKLVDYNQIQQITITINTNDSYTSCEINALNRKITMGRDTIDLIDFKTLRTFCEKIGIENIHIGF